MIRSVLLLFTIWAMIASPVLCTAGVLAHPCECEDELVCEHEDDCDVDPCGEIILRKADTQVAAPAELITEAVVQPWPPSVRSLPAFRLPDRAPPLGVHHVSDLPRLN